MTPQKAMQQLEKMSTPQYPLLLQRVQQSRSALAPSSTSALSTGAYCMSGMLAAWIL